MSPEHFDETAIRQKASVFLTRRDAGWGADEAAEFALWRAADPRHDAAVRRVETVQRLLVRLPTSPVASALLEEADQLYAGRRVTRIQPWLKLAGAFAAAACVVLIGWTLLPRSPAPISYAAAAGQHRTVDLSDGSTLLMNSESRVEIEYRSSERHVTLQQGEVHFSVAKDANRPFIVAAGNVKVRAVGTAFNVRRQSAAVEVTVTEGKVQVSREPTTGAGVNAQPIFLVAGESTSIGMLASASIQPAGHLSTEEMHERLAWQAPRLEFANTPLSEVIAQFNRYSRVQLELGDADLAARPVGGTFDGNQAEAFVNLLVAAGDVRIERISETHFVLRKAR